MANKHNSPCLQKAADDEPIFVLRAQDQSAPDIIRHWVEVNAATLDDVKKFGALQVATDMEFWHTRKLPD